MNLTHLPSGKRLLGAKLRKPGAHPDTKQVYECQVQSSLVQSYLSLVGTVLSQGP